MKIFIAAIIFFVAGFLIGDLTSRVLPKLNEDRIAALPTTPTPEAAIVAQGRSSDLSTILKNVAAVPPTEGVLAVVSGSANRLCRPDDNAVIAGAVESDELVLVVAHDESGNYRRLSDGTWVSAFLVHEVVIDVPRMDEMTPLDADWTGLKLMTPSQVKKRAEEKNEPEKAEADESKATPEPTTTPTDTPTPWPQPTGEIPAGTLLYANDLLLASGILQETGLDDVLSEGELPAVTLDWLLVIRRQLELVDEQYDRLQQMPPPTEMTDVYDQFVSAIQECKTSSELLTTGLETADLSALEQGLHSYQACRQGLTETTNIIRSYADAWAVSDLPDMTSTIMPTEAIPGK